LRIDPSLVRPVDARGSFSAQLLGRSDDDALRVADVAEQVAVLQPGDLADEFGAVRAQAGTTPAWPACPTVRPVRCPTGALRQLVTGLLAPGEARR
jgi:hypothetical protein